MDIDIGIAEQDRTQIAEGLGRLLADSYTLYLKTHNYHWNVTGPMFTSLHAMFEEEYLELAIAVDEVAERIRSLGFPAPASFAAYTKLSAIPESDDVPEALEMVRALASDHETVARTAREVVAQADPAGDVATADLATRRIDLHEKTAWMLRSVAS